jgi:hypothetical protein
LYCDVEGAITRREINGRTKGEISRMGARAGLSNEDSRRDFWGTERFGEATGDVGRVRGPMEASGDEWELGARSISGER